MTNPDAEVTDQSVEQRLENLFLAKEAPEATPEPEAEEETEVETEAEGEEPEAEAEPEAEDSEELEIEGKAYKVPKELKPYLLRQQDYTRKTQEVAEQRRAVEERAQFLQEMEQMRSVTFDKAVQLRTLESQLEQFQKVDWNQLIAADQSEYFRLDRMQRDLTAQVDRMRGEIKEALTVEQQKTAQVRQQMLEKGHAELARDIKGWGPELAKAILKGSTAYGFNDHELSQVTDPRLVKALHDAYQWRKLQESKPQIEKKASQARPMKSISRSAPKAQREGAALQARQTLKKTGSTDAAEAFFERMFSKR